MPAAMPSTANPVVTVEESFMLSNGKSPVRINHRPSKIIPKFLPVKLFVNAMLSPPFKCVLQCFKFADNPVMTESGNAGTPALVRTRKRFPSGETS